MGHVGDAGSRAFEGSEFLGFKNGKGSAALCVGLKPCTFVIETDTAIDAPFAPIMRLLTIDKLGSGQGSVTCNGSPCAARYAEGSEVTLAALPASGSSFAGWSLEECPGTGPCRVTIEADTTVAATFQANPKPPPPTGAGEGKVRVGAPAKVRAGKARTQTVKIRLSAPALRELGKSPSLRASAGGPGVLAGTVKLK